MKDAEGMYVIPGLIDLHFHGCDGAEVVDGTYDAIRKIAKYDTHIFNGMGAFHHRDTHLVGAAMDCGAFVELIGDGMHVCGSMIRAAYRIFEAERIVRIIDSLFCAGLLDEHYVREY